MANSEMTVADLRKALEQFDGNEVVCINIKQYNKVCGVAQISLRLNEHFSEDKPWNRYPMIDGSYTRCCLTVYLPDGMHTVQKNK